MGIFLKTMRPEICCIFRRGLKLGTDICSDPEGGGAFPFRTPKWGILDMALRLPLLRIIYTRTSIDSNRRFSKPIARIFSGRRMKPRTAIPCEMVSYGDFLIFDVSLIELDSRHFSHGGSIGRIHPIPGKTFNCVQEI